MASPASSPTAPDAHRQAFFTTGMVAIWTIALANLLFHVYFNNRYGYFRDEFVVTPDARFHELEAMGYPRGPEAFKIFRRQVNAAIPDEHIFVTAVRFEGDDIIEVDLDMSATHTGEEFMGIPATGREIRFDVQARGRFVDDKMAERWDRADFEEIRRQLMGPTQ
jgi:predicted ester cyclase